MSILYPLTETLLVLSYLITCFLYTRLFFSEQEQSSKLVQLGLIISLGLHLFVLVLLSGINRRCPLATPGEALLFCGLLVGSAHYASEFFSKSRQLGIFTLLPTTISVMAAAFMVSADPSLPHKQLGLLFSFHIVTSLAAYACFTIGAIISTMYVILYRKLKAKQFDVVFQKLPPLKKLELLSVIWILLGSLFMAAGSILGRMWVQNQGPDAGMNPLEYGIYTVLVVNAGALVLYKFRNLSGLKFSYTILAGFIILLISQLFGIHGF